MKNKEIEELLNKIQECDSLHNNCDYLLEHDECYILTEYIEQLERENERLQQENQKLKKQKDDVVEYIKESIKHPMYAENIIADCDGGRVENLDKLLRMLGEIDNE